MTTSQHRLVREKLDRLRTELVDLAFTLEGQRRLDAADTALMISTRIGELHEELAALSPASEFESWR